MAIVTPERHIVNDTSVRTLGRFDILDSVEVICVLRDRCKIRLVAFINGCVDLVAVEATVEHHLVNVDILLCLVQKACN